LRAADTEQAQTAHPNQVLIGLVCLASSALVYYIIFFSYNTDKHIDVARNKLFSIRLCLIAQSSGQNKIRFHTVY